MLLALCRKDKVDVFRSLKLEKTLKHIEFLLLLPPLNTLAIMG